MSRFLSARGQRLSVYTPGEQPRERRYIKLNTNESPFPPAPAVLEALQPGTLAGLRLYCDPECRELKRCLAAQYGLSPSEVFVGNGSDEALNFAFMAFGEDSIAYPDISYGFYPVFAALHGLKGIELPLLKDFSVPLALAQAQRCPVVLANPNAPTGIALPLCSIRQLLESDRERLLIVDEAYVDFGVESAVSLIPEFDNLLVVQTFSKSRSMAGARLGYALGQERLIEDLERVKYATNPYNVNALTQLLGIKTLENQAYYDACCRIIIENRAWTEAQLRALGFEVLPSGANFVFAAPPKGSAAALYEALKAQGILVRYFPRARTERYLRITIGTREEMSALVDALRALLQRTL